jgi:putative membrane protein insertion efficiency factor
MASGQHDDQALESTTARAPTRQGGWPARLARGGVIALIYLYQGVASVFPKVCRFEPSCSNYGLEAVRVHGAVTGGWLTLRRILRCRPGGDFGVDPVPPSGDGRSAGRRTGCGHVHAHGAAVHGAAPDDG